MSPAAGKAFARLYEENLDVVYSYTRYRGAPPGEAEGLTRRAFELALSRWDSYDARQGSVVLWLVGIVRDLEMDPGLAAEVREQVREAGEKRGPAPELWRALSGLDSDDRDLLALRFGARLGATEIGGIVDRGPEEVQARISQLLQRLDQDLAGAPQGASGPMPATPTATIASKTNPGTA